MNEKGFWQRHLSRRSLVRSAAVEGAGLASALALGCGPAQQTAAPTASSEMQPKYGGTLHHITSQQGVWTRGIDPHIVPTTEGGRMALFYQGLLRENPESGLPEPQIADKWEQPSQIEYLFTLNPNVRWHDKPPANGRALTVDDVIYSLNRVRTNEPQFVHRSLLNSVDKVEAVDKGTVRVTTRQPDASALSALAALPMQIVAPDVLEKAGGKLVTHENGIGTGAFMLQTMDDVTATMVRNPNYWRAGRPYLDSVVLHHIPDLQSQVAALLGGQLDATFLGGPDAKELIATKADKYNLNWLADISLFGMYANTQKPPFNDPRVSRAARLLMDHDEMVHGWAEVWLGRGRLTTGFPVALQDWDFTEEEYRQFLEWKQPKDEAVRTALSLLSAAGFNRERPLKFLTISSNGDYIAALLQLLQAQWKRLSQGIVDSDIRAMDNPTRDQFVNRGDFEYLIHGMVPTLRDPDTSLRYIYYTNGSRNYGKYSDSSLDQMIDKQRTLFDIPQRKAAVREVLRYLVDNAPYVSSAAFSRLDASQLRVQDRSPEGESYFLGYQYDKVWLDI
jgi:peptide/nickel transport system substrate-binding protein